MHHLARISTAPNRRPDLNWAIRLLLFYMILAILNPVEVSQAASIGQYLQNPTPEDQARAMLDQMTPEERIGQLFIVTFTGNQAGADSQIYDLISNRHIGGVILSAANDNFVGGETFSPMRLS